MTKLVIITGLSGSGKSSALNALEDLDFYCVDNLPIKLLEKFIELIEAGQSDVRKAALVMDLRDHQFVAESQDAFSKLKSLYHFIDIIFLDSSDEILLRRFSETRRKHPSSSESVQKGISTERKLLEPLKEMASEIIDTSAMDVHRLKKTIQKRFSNSETQPLSIRLFSFGYKHGIPKNCDLLFDVRFLSNPHFVSELRPKTGLDEDVQSYIRQDSRFAEFIEKTTDYLSFLIPQYRGEGKRYLSVGLGCTGGQHRSVFCAEEIRQRLQSQLGDQVELLVEHQDLPLIDLSDQGL